MIRPVTGGQFADSKLVCFDITRTHPHVNMSSAWKLFTVSKEDTKFAIPNTCRAKVNCGGAISSISACLGHVDFLNGKARENFSCPTEQGTIIKTSITKITREALKLGQQNFCPRMIQN